MVVACVLAAVMCGDSSVPTQVPAAFPQLFQHVHGLRFDEPPDYAYVQRTLAALAPTPPGAELLVPGTATVLDWAAEGATTSKRHIRAAAAAARQSGSGQPALSVHDALPAAAGAAAAFTPTACSVASRAGAVSGTGPILASGIGGSGGGSGSSGSGSGATAITNGVNGGASGSAGGGASGSAGGSAGPSVHVMVAGLRGSQCSVQGLRQLCEGWVGCPVTHAEMLDTEHSNGVVSFLNVSSATQAVRAMNGQCGLRVQFYTPKPPLPPPPREPRREPTAPARTASWVGSGGPGRPGGTGGFAAAMTAGGIRGGARHDEARTTRFEEPQSRGERGDGRGHSEYRSDGRGGDLGGGRVGSRWGATCRGGGGGPGGAAAGGYSAERTFSGERGGGVSGAGRSDQGRPTASRDTAYRELYAALRPSDHAHAHAQRARAQTQTQTQAQTWSSLPLLPACAHAPPMRWPRSPPRGTMGGHCPPSSSGCACADAPHHHSGGGSGGGGGGGGEPSAYPGAAGHGLSWRSRREEGESCKPAGQSARQSVGTGASGSGGGQLTPQEAAKAAASRPTQPAGPYPTQPARPTQPRPPPQRFDSNPPAKAGLNPPASRPTPPPAEQQKSRQPPAVKPTAPHTSHAAAAAAAPPPPAAAAPPPPTAAALLTCNYCGRKWPGGLVKHELSCKARPPTAAAPAPAPVPAPPVPVPQLKCSYCRRECKSAGGRGEHEQSCKDKPPPATVPAAAKPIAGIVLSDVYVLQQQPGGVSSGGYVPSDTEDNASGDEVQQLAATVRAGAESYPEPKPEPESEPRAKARALSRCRSRL